MEENQQRAMMSKLQRMNQADVVAYRGPKRGRGGPKMALQKVHPARMPAQVENSSGGSGHAVHVVYVVELQLLVSPSAVHCKDHFVSSMASRTRHIGEEKRRRRGRRRREVRR